MRTRCWLQPRFYAWAFVCMPLACIAEPSLDPLIACTRLTADTARLACFDGAMAKIQDNIPQSTIHAAPTPEQQFGLSDKRVLGLETAPGQAPPTVLHSRIANVLHSAADRQTFVLENAQTWQQIELDPDFAARIGQEVRISKGALGSFWLATDSHHATRVKRIR